MRLKPIRSGIFACAFAVALLAIGNASGATLATAERIVVKKSERRMFLLRGEEVIASYKISLGLNPEGPKQREGDFRTPEGEYRLGRRNSRSDYFLAIQVTYPNDIDVQRARTHGWRAGGSIMIHGSPNLPRHPLSYYESFDWTDGCIALSNADMVEVWLLTPDNVPIDILP